MNWDTLLSTTRVRDLSGGKQSVKSEKDVRSEFERDYGRATFSAPVRRLQDKAQVFPSDPNDIVRTRLTHSLEVSSVARDLTRQVGNWLQKEEDGFGPDKVAAIESIAATCGLIHDLGNPPFGHVGEQAIADWFKERCRPCGVPDIFDRITERPSFHRDDFFDFGGVVSPIRQTQLEQDFYRFEGNAQTLRIVARLQVLTDDYGLNFTCGTLSAASKYVAASDQLGKDKERKKPGYFASEIDLIEKLRSETGTGEARNPITYLVEASDDMVYSCADIEDAVKKGVISWAVIRQELDQVDPEVLKNVFEHMKKILGDDIDASQFSDEVKSQVFRISALAVATPAVIEAFQHRYSRIMNGTYHDELVGDKEACSVHSLIDVCQKKIARKYIYCSPEILKREISGQRVIRDLMDIFWEGASQYPEKGEKTKDAKSFPGKIYELLSPNYRRVFEKSLTDGELPKRYYKMRLVTDYICGMTDSFACTLHNQLTNG